MFELVARSAAQDAQRPAIITHAGTTTYAQLAIASRRVAGYFHEHSITRVAVADFEAEATLPVLLGGSLAGVEVCLYPPDDHEVLADLARRFEHDVIITDRHDLSAAAGRLLSTAEVQQAAELDAEVDGARPHMVLTTGTTGVPRGVRHDWSRLVRGTRRIRPAAGQRWLLAYGLHQFAGLQVLLHVFASGATLVAPAPRRPREGLAAMRAFDVTHASATPTYWRFLLTEMRSDGGPVPNLQQITLGGEAIPGPLLDELTAAFPDAAISQVYAASEFGSSGSMRDGRAGLSAAVLNRGDDADVDMRVENGELWVRSRTGMLGYYGDPPVDPDAWRATGDLVEIVDDRIVFKGRSSDIINVGGVKVHPLPIEERIAAIPTISMARVFGRPNAMTGAIVALEVVLTPGADPGETKTAIREACADLAAAARPRSIKFVDDIVTAGSKIIRRNP